MYADIHLHSNYSDGTLSVKQLVEKAKLNNVSLISICDHHSIRNYKELAILCANNSLNYLYGLEINASLENDGSYVHILGYNPDPMNVILLDLLDYCISIYDDMSYELIKHMSNDYGNISINEYINFIFTGKFGGWKAYEYLLTKNIICHLQDYFNFISLYGINKPDFILANQVCSILKYANGVPVLAHPGNTFSPEKLNYYLDLMKECGIEGIECYYPHHTSNTTQICLEYCETNDLLITGGSDDHGDFMIDDKSHFIGMNNFKVNINSLYLGNLNIY